MKRVIFTALGVVFLCLKISGQAITNPQVPVTGNVGCVGFPCLNNGTLNFTADANQTMTAIQTSANGGVKITSTVSLTATRTLIVPSGNFQFMDIENATLGAQAVSVCSTTGGSCVTIPNGATIAGVWFDGTNFVAPSAGGGGSMTYPAANTLGLSNGSANAWTTPTYANIVSLWSSCTSGYLQYNGTCNTPSGGGTVTTVGVTAANGVSGTVVNPTTTPAITLTLGAITPSSVAATGPVTGTSIGAGASPPSTGSATGALALAEASTAVTPTAGVDYLRADSTAHNFKLSLNGGAEAIAGTTVSGVSCPLGGTCAPPLVCAGAASPCYLQQINPTTSFSTTTTASIATGTTSVPVASCSGFTFAPGAIVLFQNNSAEWTVATSCIGTTLTLSTRAYYGTAAGAWASGTQVYQMTSGYATSASTAPYYYTLSNGFVSFGGNSANSTANTVVFNGTVSALGGFTAAGFVNMSGGSTTLYSAQGNFYEPANPGSSCSTSGAVYQQYSGSNGWFAGDTSTNCTLGTNILPPNSFVLVPGTTSGNPGAGATPAMTISTAGVVNVPTGGSYNINGVPISGGGTPTVTTLSGTTPAIALSAASSLYTITLSGNTTPTISGITAGYAAKFQVCQPATGGPYTWTWPSAVHGGITIGTTASACSEQTFDSFSGSTLVASSTGVINVLP